MIIKITNFGNNSEVDFWMFDNIVKVSVRKKVEKPNEYCEDVMLVERTDVKDCISLRCRDKRDREISIVFDSVAYICNDDGKTIEKITVFNK